MDLKKEIKLSDLVPKGLARKQTQRKQKAKTRKRTMPKEIVGLKIESSAITAAQIVNNGAGKSIVNVARTPLARGIVTGGEVRDPAALAIALTNFFATNKLPRRGVRLGLGNSRIGVRIIEVPGTENHEQLENAIRFRAHEMLSVSLDEAVIDYHILGETVDENGEKAQRILLVVAYRDSIDRYLAATDAADLEVVGIDLEAFALLRAAAPPDTNGEARNSALVVVSVDDERTTLAISDGEVCHFTRVLEWGDATIDSAVGRGLRISDPEAADLRRKLSGLDELPDDEQLVQQATALREIVNYEIHALVRELQSSLRFYQSQPGSLPIGVVLLSGALADLIGFADELRTQLGIPLEVVDPFVRATLRDNAVRPTRSRELTVAIGLGIED